MMSNNNNHEETSSATAVETAAVAAVPDDYNGTRGGSSSSSSSSSILANKRQRAASESKLNQQQQQQQHLSNSSSRDSATDAVTAASLSPPPSAANLISESTTTTTLPGAVHIPGWRRRRRRASSFRDDDDDGSESTNSTPVSVAAASSSSSSRLDAGSLHEHQLQLQHQQSIEILSAQLVDEDEMQRHAEFLFQQMLSQAAVAELVDEDEIRRQAQEQAAQEILLLQQQQQQQEKDQIEKAGGERMLLSIMEKKNKRRRRIIIAAGCCIVMTVIIAVVVIVTAVVLSSSSSQDDNANGADATDNNNLPITNTILPNSGSSTSTLSPVVTTPPSTSSMPTAAASSWQQIGNSINGIRYYEQFGYELAFSANGNTVVAAAQNAGQVRAYTLFHNETATKALSASSSTSTYSSSNIWQPLGPFFITRDGTNDTFASTSNYNDKICLSPNGKFVALIYNDFDTGSRIRIFALTDRSNYNNNVNMDTSSNATTTTTTNDTESSAANSDNFVWEQIGPDIVHSSSFSFSTTGDVMEWIMSASLTDNLVLAIGCYTGEYFNPGSDRGTVYMYHQLIVENDPNNNNNNSTSWIRMGQEIQLHAWSLQLALVQDNTSSSNNSTLETTPTLILAVGGRYNARTFRYEPDMNSWTQFGSELAADIDDDVDDINELSGVGVMLSLSMTDGKTLIVGVRNDAVGQGIGLLRTYLYDAATDDWIQMDQDLKGSTFLFGQSFALSGNGKMLVTTTQELDMIVQSGAGRVTGQIRTWDFIDTTTSNNDQSTSDGALVGGAAARGKWIQRGAALEVGTLESGFGFKIALSEDGNRLATSAIQALNEQGVQSGKIRVYEQY